MSNGITICIVGAGSSYTPELIEGILNHPVDQLPITAIRMTDIDEKRLEIMAGLATRMAKHAGRDISITADTNLEKMLGGGTSGGGVNFVITQIRVGGTKARFLDESIPLKYGIIGQETTGPGGMLKALRTIPKMLEIARAVETHAPDAFILNYTNPSGIIAEAVSKHTNAKIIGLCSGIPYISKKITDQLADTYPGLETYCVGLNHFGFIHRMIHDGKDVTADAIDKIREMTDQKNFDNAGMSPVDVIKLLGAVPIAYAQFFYDHAAKLADLKTALEKNQTRAQVIEKIETEIFTQASDPQVHTKPEALCRRGGGGYSQITFDMLKAILNDTGEKLPANVPNKSSVDQIDDDAVVEVICRVDKNGATPLPVGQIPMAFRGLVLALKAYETLTVEAAVKCDKSLAIQALANHPLCGDLAVIKPMLDEMLAAHGLEYK